MGYKPKPITDPSKIIRIECVDAPQHYAPGEGDYEVSFGHRFEVQHDGTKKMTKDYYDLPTLDKFLQELWPERSEDILNRLQNFKRAYLRLDTSEITS